MKYIIIKPNCREFANHLLNYVSIYAYGIETGARIYNPSFLKWHKYFNLSKKESWLTRVVSSFPAINGLWRMLCFLYGSYLIRARTSCVQLTLGMFVYLPPTKQLVSANVCDTTYFIGWLFRNPVGLELHRDALVAVFTPKEGVLKKIETSLAPFGAKRLIGVHLRQQPYKWFADGSFLIPLSRVRMIIDEYLREKKLSADDVAIILVSDREIDRHVFMGYETYVSNDDEVTNMFLLSKCSAVIGVNSSFGNLAAWFGNVPHIVQSNGPMDWEYYRNPTSYFVNKYATFTH